MKVLQPHLHRKAAIPIPPASPSPLPPRARAVSAAKVGIGTRGRHVGQEAIQMHGGMGMTDELKVGHYFKRVSMIDAMFGNTDHHLDRFGAASMS